MTVETNLLEIQSSSDNAQGDLGFRLTGHAKDDSGRRARIWLRKKKDTGRRIWRRYIAPVVTSETWEICLYEQKTTGAMTALPYHDETLERIAQEYTFPKEHPELATLQSLDVNDPVYKQAVDWAVAQMS